MVPLPKRPLGDAFPAKERQCGINNNGRHEPSVCGIAISMFGGTRDTHACMVMCMVDHAADRSDRRLSIMS